MTSDAPPVPSSDPCDAIAAFYETAEHFAWEHLTGGQIHLGYWDDANADAPFAEGVRRLTQEMIEHTEVAPGERFVDLGCGVGEPALELVRQKDCLVDGVTLSPYQRDEAAGRAAAAGLADKVSFHLENAVALPFAEGHFHGGWFFESIFHMGHEQALREAHRVLAPGAVLTLTDVSDIGALPDEARAAAKEACNAEYVRAETYPDMLRRAGFEPLLVEDITDRVIAPFAAKFTAAVTAHKEEVLAIFKGDQERFEAFVGVTAKFSTIGYVLVKARKVA